MMSDRLYLLTIRLLGIEPEIWRSFVVPAGITLNRLHDVIQIVMGWEDDHLYEFVIGKKRCSNDPESEKDGLNDRLCDLVNRKGGKLLYIYDFGDYWEHEIKVEDTDYSNTNLSSEIQCLDGARACPPEDVGGVPGYYHFCEALKDPDNEENADYLEWGGDYESEKFNIAAVNHKLTKYSRSSRNQRRPS
jgi:hypothetical protein